MALCGLLLAIVPCASPSAATPRELLPDLDQESPTALTVSRVAAGANGRSFLGFGSAARNVGDGPLTDVDS